MPPSLALFQARHRYGLTILAPFVVKHFENSLVQACGMQETMPDVEQQVTELRGELRKVRQERVLEVTERKALGTANDRTMIETLVSELDAAKRSETLMLESLALQTKQLEIAKMELEEAKLDVTSLQQTVQKLETSTPTASPRARSDRDQQRVHAELRVALVAEEKSKKAMEELVVTLKEVRAELHATRQQLARAQHEAETARLESERLHVSLKRRDEKLRSLADEVVQLRADADESFAAWRDKEAGFTACMRATEADLAASRRESARLLESQRSGRDEIAKLRDILRQAVKDTKFVKEALEEARSENAMLKEMVCNKDNAASCSNQELECLRVSDAAACDSVNELQNVLVATSSSPTAAAAVNFDPEETSSPHSSIELPVLEKSISVDGKVDSPADYAQEQQQLSETLEEPVYDIFGSIDDQKVEVGGLTGMPRLPGRRRVVMRKVGSLFRWKSSINK